MKKPKTRIYLDTSVISYHMARSSRDQVIRSRQQATRRWWDDFQELADFHVPTHVLAEIAAGDSIAACRRAELVSGLPILVSDARSEAFGLKLLRDLKIPLRSRQDAFHLAVAALNGQNYIISWNFKHMANASVRRGYEDACRSAGLLTPEIVTPVSMMEDVSP